MKQFAVGAVIFLFTALTGNALIFPDGTDAPVKDMDGNRYTLLEPTVFDTPAGKLKVDKISFHETGEVDSCVLEEPQLVNTPAGKLKVDSISFRENGEVQRCSFEEPQLVNTPAGKLKVSSISFHATGEVDECYLEESTASQHACWKVEG